VTSSILQNIATNTVQSVTSFFLCTWILTVYDIIYNDLWYLVTAIFIENDYAEIRYVCTI